MKVTVQKWGNSLAVRVPVAFAKEAALTAGSTVEMTQVEGKIILAPVRRPVYRLANLVARITPRNRHAQVDWGPPLGKELW